MYIKNISIDSFGKLKSFNMDLSEGINVICGENESGKSTVTRFIKYMLYGFTGTSRTKNLLENERAVCLPWDTESASGKMTVSFGGTDYLISRHTTKKTDEVTVTDLLTGKTVDTSLSVGEYFLGLPEPAFTRSVVTMQQNGCDSGGKELSGHIQNMLFSAEGDEDSKKAQKALYDAMTELRLQKGEGGKLHELETKIAEMNHDYEEAKQKNATRIQLCAEIAGHKEDIAKFEQAVELLEKELKDAKDYNSTAVLDKIESARKTYEEKRELRQDRQNKLPENYREGLIIAIDRAFEKCGEGERRTLNAREDFQNAEQRLKEYGALDYTKEALLADKKAFSKYNSAFAFLAIFATASALSAVICALLIYFVGAPFIIGACGGCVALSVLLSVLSAKNAKAHKLICKKYSCTKNTFEKTLSELDERINNSASARGVAENARKNLEREEKDRLTAYKELSGLILTDVGTADEAISAIAPFKEVLKAYEISAEDEKDALSKLQTLSEGIDCEKFRNIRNTVPPPRRSEEVIERDINLNKSKLKFAMEAERSKSDELNTLKTRPPIDIKAELDSTLAEYVGEKERYEAIKLAWETVKAAGDNLKNSIAPTIAGYAGELLERLTGGKYSTVTVDDEFAVSVMADGMPRPVEYLSAGTRDMVYISFRYGLIKLLFHKEKPFMIFDDAFVRMDDGRLEKLIRALSQKSTDSQILILSCHDREAKMLNDGNITVKKI